MPTTSFGVVRGLCQGVVARRSDVLCSPFETAMMSRFVGGIEAFEVGCAVMSRRVPQLRRNGFVMRRLRVTRVRLIPCVIVMLC